MLDKIAKHFDFQQKALGLRAYRTEVLSSNIANSDTPYYKAVDFNFKDAMTRAIGEGESSMEMAKTHQTHLDGFAEQGGKDFNLQYRTEVQPSIDGNTVDMDLERSAFADNALKYQSTLTFLNRRISGLSDAIKGERKNKSKGR
jgi:flagellar basal-body rod protein FlgB